MCKFCLTKRPLGQHLDCETKLQRSPLLLPPPKTDCAISDIYPGHHPPGGVLSKPSRVPHSLKPRVTPGLMAIWPVHRGAGSRIYLRVSRPFIPLTHSLFQLCSPHFQSSHLSLEIQSRHSGGCKNKEKELLYLVEG
jgi:hypothetical protein